MNTAPTLPEIPGPRFTMEREGDEIVATVTTGDLTVTYRGKSVMVISDSFSAFAHVFRTVDTSLYREFCEAYEALAEQLDLDQRNDL